jgi:hypothetical protein
LQGLEAGQGVPWGAGGFQVASGWSRLLWPRLAGPDGLLNPCGAAVVVGSKHTDAYQQPPASLLTVMFSIRARPRTRSRRSWASARRGRGEGDPPVLGDPQATRLKA